MDYLLSILVILTAVIACLAVLLFIVGVGVLIGGSIWQGRLEQRLARQSGNRQTPAVPVSSPVDTDGDTDSNLHTSPDVHRLKQADKLIKVGKRSLLISALMFLVGFGSCSVLLFGAF